MALPKIWPFAHNVPIVYTESGNPTPYFSTQLQLLLEASGVFEGDIATINDSITTIEGDITTIETTLANLSIDDLTDVDTSTTPPTDGQALVWVDADSEWAPGNVASGGGSVFSGALVKKSADQTAANYSGYITVAWDAEEYDTDNYHNNVTANTRLTVPADGYYRVGVHIQVASGTLTSGDYIRLSMGRYNSGSVLQSRIGIPDNVITEINATPAISLASLSMPIYCNAGDFFLINFDTEADTSITIVAATSWFGIERVG